MSILITGGAGYIGTHLLHELTDHDVVIVDDFSTGLRERAGDRPVVELNLADDDAATRLEAAMREHDVTAVVHFAARKQVGESVEKPIYYYRQNVLGMMNLLDAMEAADVKELVFSSSAASYGLPHDGYDGPVAESALDNPISPYGETKLVCEWMCRAAAEAWGLRWAGLRYFNVAGAGSPDLWDPAVLNLIPLVFRALSQGKNPMVFGDDYPTPDGTCIRDYIHVVDLAKAHVCALNYVSGDKALEENVFNIATGTGSSVLDVLDAIRDVTGNEFTHDIVGRRAGDPPMLVANPTTATKYLKWEAEKDLRDMVSSAWDAWGNRPTD